MLGGKEPRTLSPGGDCKASERVNRGPWGRTRQPMQGLQDPRRINLGDGEEGQDGQLGCASLSGGWFFIESHPLLRTLLPTQ